jgi:energy-converting hydrogenase Eha subunit F
MDKEETAILKHISDTLDRLLEIISKPQNIVTQIFNIGAAIVGILGILAIVDLIVSWLKG